MSNKGWFYAQLEAIRHEMRERRDMFYMYELTAPVAGAPGLATINLENEFGRLRVNNSGIDEMWYAAAAIGGSLVGTRTVAHIPYQAGTIPFELVTQHAAKLRHMTGGKVTVPCVLFIDESAQSPSLAGQHSDYEFDAYYAHVAGVKTVVPSTVYDAKGLMHAAIRDPDTVIYLNPGALRVLAEDVPEEPYEVPIGKAAVRTEGSDITLISSGPGMIHVQAAVQRLQQEGVSAGSVDLRTLNPLDRDTIVGAVQQTGRLLAVDLGKYTGGVGAEVAASVAEAVPGVKIRRLAYPDASPPAAPEMFQWMAINAERVYDAARTLLRA